MSWYSPAEAKRNYTSWRTEVKRDDSLMEITSEPESPSMIAISEPSSMADPPSISESSAESNPPIEGTDRYIEAQIYLHTTAKKTSTIDNTPMEPPEKPPLETKPIAPVKSLQDKLMECLQYCKQAMPRMRDCIANGWTPQELMNVLETRDTEMEQQMLYPAGTRVSPFNSKLFLQCPPCISGKDCAGKRISLFIYFIF
jgi:hypothetical protein